jgi:predicted nuclease of predicted toxin-antitoxin system
MLQQKWLSMKLLLDANISRRIVPEITEYFGECVHVNTIGLPLPPTDLRIWNYAKQYEYIIVTQDTDFLHFFEAKGFPPKVGFSYSGGSASLRFLLSLAPKRVFVLRAA